MGTNVFYNSNAVSDYYCYKNSVMDKYARNNGLGTAEHYYGDVNSDDEIDINDIGFIMSVSADLITNLTDVQKIVADYNLDGVIDGFDAAAIDTYANVEGIKNHLHTDDFDDYAVNTTISSGSTPYFVQYNGTGNGNQVIISDGTNGKLLQLQGSSGWAADVRYNFTADDKQYLVLEFDVKPVSGSDPGGVNFGSSGAGGTWTNSVCRFGLGTNGEFYCGKNDSATVINTSMTHSNGNWYHLKMVLDRTNNIYYTFVDGVLLDENGFQAASATPEWFSLGAGNNGTNTIYYDNIDLYSSDSSLCITR